jgi:hypothetical protein
MQLPVSPLPDGRGRAPPLWGTSANTRRSAALHAIKSSRTGTATTASAGHSTPSRRARPAWWASMSPFWLVEEDVDLIDNLAERAMRSGRRVVRALATGAG